MESVPHPLSLANDIANWLGGLQVLTPHAELKGELGLMAISFDHPIEGRIRRILSGHGILRVEGIGFELPSPANGLSTAQCYDYGAIYDPLDGFVPGNHYATSNFAWLCALLANGCFSTEIRGVTVHDRILAALDFQVRTCKRYVFSRAEPHWEFNNLAWMETYLLMLRTYPPSELRRLHGFLRRAPFHPRPHATNWKAMLALFFLLRSHITRSPLDRLIGNFYLRWSWQAIQPDGSISDSPRNRSRGLQYHAYTGALMARICRHFGGDRLRAIVTRAALYLCEFIDPDGDFNYKGRGQRQIFGYAAAIYLLREAMELSPQHTQRFAEGLLSIYRFLSHHVQEDGYLPLILNNLQDQRVGWYDYHHLTVYNSFAAVWLALAAHVGDWPESGRSTHGKSLEKSVRVFVSEESSVIVARTGDYFCCISGGENEYAADTGLAPHHLWISTLGQVISCPGGPEPVHRRRGYSTPEATLNYMAPITILEGTWHNPGTVLGHLKRKADGVSIAMEYGGIRVLREVQFLPKTIVFDDHISVTGRNVPLELLLFNLPIIVDRIEVEVDQTNSLIWLKSASVANESKVFVSCFCSWHEPWVFRLWKRIPLCAGTIQVISTEPLRFRQPVTVRVRQEWVIL